MNVQRLLLRALVAPVVCNAAVAVAALSSCATSETAEPAEQTILAMAPIPFRAAQLRAANPQGKRYRWKVSTADGAVVDKVFVFDAVDDRGATVTASDVGADGVTQQTQTATSTWNELRMHGAFPANITTIEDKEVTVPAGTFACKWYSVREDDGAVAHFCFVLDCPGPPVFFDRWKGDVQLMKSELVEPR